MPALLGYRIPLTPRLYFAVQRVPWWYAPRIGQWLTAHNLLPNDATILGVLLAPPTGEIHREHVLIATFTMVLVAERPDGVPEGTQQRMTFQDIQAESLLRALTQWAEEP